MIIRIIKASDLQEVKRAVKSVGADAWSAGHMSPKGLFRTVLVEKIDNRAASILKQEMLALGAEAAIDEKISRFARGFSKVLLMGTERHFELLSKKLASQPFGLKALSGKVAEALLNYGTKPSFFRAAGSKVALGKGPVVMGVLNVTPDSFYDGGRYGGREDAVSHALSMQREGAEIIDIGGESSRPGAASVSAQEERKRIIPVIKRLAKVLNVPISVDTCKPEVARAALDAGAEIVNDITGLRHQNGGMAKVVSRAGAGVIIMHMQGMPKSMQKKPRYGDVMSDICGFFGERTAFALDSGIKKESIAIDPGIGFGKKVWHNLKVIKNLSELTAFGFPVAIGLSRKSFIGKILGGCPPHERYSGSVAGAVVAALNGADILRVHDVKGTVESLKVMKRIIDTH
ncbi:MAG: dihydropteroate synthase [Endomicrobiales bacterium]|nr:dihydropteroate synthase [Endomicrobiales bacterium]